MEVMQLRDTAGNGDQATSPTAMVMSWTPEFQSIAFGQARFSHHGTIGTDPSHDLAHLLIAASGNMPWAPEGDDATIRIAEYNAVLIENILDKTFHALLARRLKDDLALTQAAAHAAWFVEEHFAPFPISAEEAYRQFARDIDSDAIVRLSPYFFRMKLGERNATDFRAMDWRLDADAMAAPEIEGPVERKYVDAVRHQMWKLKTTDLAAIIEAPATPVAQENTAGVSQKGMAVDLLQPLGIARQGAVETACGANGSPTAMVMNWTTQFQSIAFGDAEFSHRGTTNTHPSHDLAHLFIAASGNMPWAPEGDDATIRLAEYNAILVERIMDNTFTALITRRLKDDDAATEALNHMTGFVERWAPFPISAEEALSRFARNLDTEMIVRLSPYFFRMKLAEAKDPEFGLTDWTLSADAMIPPGIEGPVERKYVEALRHQMTKLKTIDLGRENGIIVEDVQSLDTSGQIAPEPGGSPTAIVMNWTPTFQSIAFGEAEFSHSGAIETNPSHDLAHLLIAASGNMPWAPEGDDRTIRVAEYNAVLVENLLNRILDALIGRRLKEDKALTEAATYAAWFVENHYAPFPLSAEEAYSQFARDIDAEAIVRLSPYYFRMKLAERKDREFRSKDWGLSADAMTAPEIEGSIERKYVDAVRRQMTLLTTSRWHDLNIDSTQYSPL